MPMAIAICRESGDQSISLARRSPTSGMMISRSRVRVFTSQICKKPPTW